MPEKSQEQFALLPGDFFNLGDAMLSLAAARRIAQDGSRCILLPYRQPSTSILKEFEREDFLVVSIRESPWLALRACQGSSVRIGGGHAIRNEVSLGWLLFTFIVSIWAQLSGRSVRVVGAGASSIRSTWKSWFFAGIFNLCDLVCVRDGLSAELLKREFPMTASKVRLVGDVAFLKNCLDLHSHLQEPLTCLVSPAIDIGEGRIENPAEIMSLLRTLSGQSGMNHVIIVSHDSRSEFDFSFCRNLQILIEEELPITVEIIEKESIEDGLLKPYGRARWIITGRLHGLIIGALQSRRVFYTAGSAKKLRPFAEMFNFEAAANERVAQMLGGLPESTRTAVVMQQEAAERNFQR